MEWPTFSMCLSHSGQFFSFLFFFPVSKCLPMSCFFNAGFSVLLPVAGLTTEQLPKNRLWEGCCPGYHIPVSILTGLLMMHISISHASTRVWWRPWISRTIFDGDTGRQKCLGIPSREHLLMFPCLRPSVLRYESHLGLYQSHSPFPPQFAIWYHTCPFPGLLPHFLGAPIRLYLLHGIFGQDFYCGELS